MSATLHHVVTIPIPNPPVDSITDPFAYIDGLISRLDECADRDEKAGRLKFTAALDTCEIIGLLKLAIDPGSNALVTTEQFLYYADQGGVKRTRAYDIIKYRLHAKRIEIEARVEADFEQHLNADSNYAFDWPTLQDLINFEKARHPATAGAKRATSPKAPPSQKTTAALKIASSPTLTTRNPETIAYGSEQELIAELRATIANLRAERDAAIARAEAAEAECERLKALLANPEAAPPDHGPIRSQRPETLRRNARRARQEAGIPPPVRTKMTPEEARNRANELARDRRAADREAGIVKPRTQAAENSMRNQMASRKAETAATRAITLPDGEA